MAVDVIKTIVAIEANTTKIKGQLGTLEGNFKSSFSRIGGIARSALGGIGAALVIRGVARMITKVTDLGDQLQKMSIRTGFAVEALSALKFQAELGGASIEDFEKGLKLMSQGLSDAARGTGEAKDVLADMGFTLEDLAQAVKDPQPFLEEFARRFSKIESSITRTNVAARVFGGKAGVNLIPFILALAEKGFARFIKEAERANALISDEFGQASATFKDNILKMEKSLLGLQIFIAGPVIGAFNDLVTAMGFVDTTSIKKNLASLETELRILEGFQKFLPLLQALELVGITPLAGQIERVKKQISELEEIQKEIDALKSKQKDRSGAGDTPSAVDKVDDKKTKAFVKSLEAQFKKLTEQSILLTEGKAALEDYKFQLLATSIANAKLTESEAERAQQVLTLTQAVRTLTDEQERQAKLDELTKDIKSLDKELSLGLLTESERRIQIITDEMEGRLRRVDEWVEAMEAAGKDTTNIETQAAGTRIKIHQNAIEQIKGGLEELNEFWIEALRSIERAGSDLLFNLFEGNVGSLEEFANSLRSSINRMAADILSAQLLSKANQVFGGALGIPGAQQGGSKAAAIAEIQAQIAALQATAQTVISTAAATGQTALQTTSATAQGGIQAMLTEALTAIQAIQATALAAIQAASAGTAVSGGSFLAGLFGGGGGGGGGFGGGGGVTAPNLPLPPTVGFGHAGGIVGSHAMPHRMISLSAFKHADRFRFGGIAGLSPNEVPIVAHAGEEIITASDPRHRARGGRGGINVTLNINTPDANSFRRSGPQIEALMAQSVRRGMKRL